MENSAKLRIWKERLSKAQTAWSDEEWKMDERERLYRGEVDRIRPVTKNDTETDGSDRTAYHVQNIIAENIEAEVNSSIPQPKVTARQKKDEEKAKLIENMIRNELNRLPFEAMNDLMERMVPIQGGGLWLVEWDSAAGNHDTSGEVTVRTIHPKQIVPQEGVYTGVEDMDYIILKLPQTKEYIRRRYGISLADEGESDPEARGDDQAPSDEMVTQYIAYYRAENGKIGLFSWCNDKVLEDLEDYQARHLKRCAACGEPEPGEGEEKCPRCGGSKWVDSPEEYEEIYTPRILRDGRRIPGATYRRTQTGEIEVTPTRIPYYKPDCYPVVLQRNVSVFGRLLGESDVDKIKSQQNTLTRINQKILDRMVKAGTRITLPDQADLRVDSEDSRIWHVGNAADAALIKTHEFSGNLQYEMMFRSAVYNEARNILGITDSFQGRQDSTAASGKAKEISAAQAAGRLESKRIMKDAAYADLFRLIFQFKLAYAEEPRPVVFQNEKGERQYGEFDRWDFLETDESGNYWWNDQFLFACDTSAPLANNREAMWNNTTAQLRSGCYGNPAELDTLILYWTKMDLLHYPGAGDTLTYLQAKKQEAMQLEMLQQQAAMMADVPPAMETELPPEAPASGVDEYGREVIA